MKNFFSGQENEEILRATGLFDGFEWAELEAALEFLDAKAFTYEKGACIMLAGNRQACGLVLSGLVQITAEDYYGNRSIMSKAGAGELFGEVFACAGIAEAPVSVFAAERTQIMFLNCGPLLQESAVPLVHTERLCAANGELCFSLTLQKDSVVSFELVPVSGHSDRGYSYERAVRG